MFPYSFFFLLAPSTVALGCPRLMNTGYDLITRAVVGQLDHPGSWHMLCHSPSFGVDLQKSLLSLLKPVRLHGLLMSPPSYNHLQLTPQPALGFFPAKSLIGMEGAKEPTLWEGNPQRTGTEGDLHCHQAAQPILSKMPETQHSQNSSPAVTSTEGAWHCWLL